MEIVKATGRNGAFLSQPDGNRELGRKRVGHNSCDTWDIARGALLIYSYPISTNISVQM